MYKSQGYYLESVVPQDQLMSKVAEYSKELSWGFIALGILVLGVLLSLIHILIFTNTVRHPDNVESVLESAMKTDGPVLVNIMTDPNACLLYTSPLSSS